MKLLFKIYIFYIIINYSNNTIININIMSNSGILGSFQTNREEIWFVKLIFFQVISWLLSQSIYIFPSAHS